MYKYQKISETFIPINSSTMPVSNSIDITNGIDATGLYDNDIVIIQKLKILFMLVYYILNIVYQRMERYILNVYQMIVFYQCFMFPIKKK